LGDISGPNYDGIFQKTIRKDFECFHNKEMINGRYVYPLLNIIQCVHLTIYHMEPKHMYNLYGSIKNFKSEPS
jgi:hypothetical protein